jgi:hypothetical protein
MAARATQQYTHLAMLPVQVCRATVDAAERFRRIRYNAQIRVNVERLNAHQPICTRRRTFGVQSMLQQWWPSNAWQDDAVRTCVSTLTDDWRCHHSVDDCVEVGDK